MKDIKKLFLGVSLGLVLSFSSYANTASIILKSGGMTNLLSFGPNFGAATITSAAISSATVSSNTLVQFVDTYTNSLVYTNASYTNRISYATNYVYSWTNFYGVVYTNNQIGAAGTLQTNIMLIDATNVVNGSTNLFPVLFTAGAPSGGAISLYPNLNANAQHGIWVTNLSSSDAAVTITY